MSDVSVDVVRLFCVGVGVGVCVWCVNFKLSVVRSDDRSSFVVSSGHRSVGLSECQNFNRLNMSDSQNVCMDADNQMSDIASP